MCFFFFQAEDGIRDIGVTGVQTCALPIWRNHRAYPSLHRSLHGREIWRPVRGGFAVYRLARTDKIISQSANQARTADVPNGMEIVLVRSEERRVGKE